MPVLYHFDPATAAPPDWLPTAADMGLGRYIILPRVVGRRRLVALDVEGDCLAPVICDGDIVIIDVHEQPAHGRYAWIVQPTPQGTLNWLKRLERRRGRWHFMMADGRELRREPGMSIRGIVVAWLTQGTDALHIEPWANTRQTRPEVPQ